MSVWLDYLHEHQDQAIQDLIEFLKIPSISTDPELVGEVKRAAEWVAARLSRAGIEDVKIHPTAEHFCVTGEWLNAPGKPTLLIYGHFDVQPADPLELWESPPFEPRIEGNRIYARGASDMKANVLLPILAVEAMLATQGSLPVNVKFLLEGQEEIGSRDLGPFVTANKELLSCDHIVSADSSQWSEDQGAIIYGVKGLCACTIEIETSTLDLHSGLYGGAVPNAAHAVAELVASMHDLKGNVVVDHFYDQVRPLSDQERERFAALPYDETSYKVESGTEELIGEAGFSAIERTSARPTLEINGIWSGYQGQGIKTVIPAKAYAKISCRLVPDQDPETTLQVLEEHIRKHTPKGAKVTVTRYPSKANPYVVPLDDPGTIAVADVLREQYGREPYYQRLGGSPPITDLFLRELGVYTSNLGMSLPDERFHSPNEFYRLTSYAAGQQLYGKLFERFGGVSA